MKVQNKKLQNGDLELIITFDNHDQICLEHDLVDIVEWYKTGPCAEKIKLCEKRMINEHKENILMDASFDSLSHGQVKEILSNNKKIVEEIKKNPKYKNRKQREEESKRNL